MIIIIMRIHFWASSFHRFYYKEATSNYKSTSRFKGKNKKSTEFYDPSNCEELGGSEVTSYEEVVRIHPQLQPRPLVLIGTCVRHIWSYNNICSRKMSIKKNKRSTYQLTTQYYTMDPSLWKPIKYEHIININSYITMDIYTCTVCFN